MSEDSPGADNREYQKEEAENLVPQRVYGLHSGGQYVLHEQAGLTGELTGLPGIRHPAPGESPRYTSQLLRVRHALMLSDRESIVRPGFRLYNQGD